MRLESLHIDNFRCIEFFDAELAPGVNCLVGDNASGKTSFLEAIYVLGRGESFRQARLGQTIRHGADTLTLRTRLADGDGGRHRIGCHISRSSQRFKLDDQADTRRFDLINMLPLQHIDPNVHRLLEQGPKYRRHFLDWGVFHVEHAFFPAWRRYRRALKQRNRALRAHQPKHIVIAWDAELVQQGELIDACRRRYLEHIKHRLPDTARQLVGDDALAFSYHPGWRGDGGFGQALARGLEQDLRAGFTQQGPHRADTRISIASMQARDWVSRGQQKLLTAALLLAQADILQSTRRVQPVLLLDDMAAELGGVYRETLAREVERLGVQCFVTFLDSKLIPQSLRDTRMFHVKHGKITPS
ncbi:DNA replication/repair protein RecF [Salinisphaera sp.]|uniref:DNA replication/repair protein RecF n=1 Tax=Salinisphaera sp. TaxID=1914330 RepID=UPI002D76F06F|nr:DNA replication/repair protein RecF [Salinisphaera sp.]HET7313317.1 DNA replication/repair protein RecF [Salinisphaera sp.]